MTSKDLRIPLAEKIAVEWNRQSIDYSVIHGLENYPENLGRDLDILIKLSDAKKAACIAINIANSEGFNEHIFRWSHWGLYQLALIDRNNGISLPIDLMCTTRVWQAKFINMFNKKDLEKIIKPDSHVGPFASSVEGTFYKTCVRALICGDLRRFGHELKLPIQIPTQIDRNLLSDIIGSYGTKILLSKSTKELSYLFPKAMYKIQTNWIIKHPMRLFPGLLKIAWRRIGLTIFTSSDVLIVNSKHSQKTFQILQELQPIFKRLFIEVHSTIFNGSKTGEIYGNTIAWRQKPISEFKINAIVINNGINNNTNKTFFLPRLGRLCLSADGFIQIPDNISPTKEKNDLYKIFINYMTNKYCYNL